MSIAWVPHFGVVGLILILVGIHASYFRDAVRHDTRFDIQLSFAPDRGVEYFLNLHERITHRADNRRGSNTILEVECATEPDGTLAVLVADMPFRLGNTAQHARLSVTSWNDVYLEGSVEAPYVFAKQIQGFECDRIEIGCLVAAEDLALSATYLRTGSVRIGARGRLEVQQLSASKISSPDLCIEQKKLHLNGARDKMLRPLSVPRLPNHPMKSVVVGRAVSIPRDTTVYRPVIAYDDMEIGDGVIVEESLKVYGDLKIGNGVELHGPVVINGNLYVGENCVFLSDVVTKGRLFFGKDTTLGWPNDTLVTVIARQMYASGSLRLAGTMLSSLPFGIRYG